jgi:DNA-binding NarL/FixJ family response regulator
MSAPGREVNAAVVDADTFGFSFIADLRAVFPSVPVVAISGIPARRTQALRAGAAVALPRTTSAAQLAAAIARAAGR